MKNTSKYFDALYNNAKANAMLIMSKNGIVQEVNEAFTSAYGYTTDDLHSRHFRILYIEKDKATLRPEIELNKTLREGSSSDENYLVHKDGTPVWVTGETILVDGDEDRSMVKIIHNIHAQKQLERHLLASDELLDQLFGSVKAGLLLLDSSIRTIKCNNAFLKLFNLENPVEGGSKMQEIPHSFWTEEEIKNDIRNAVVKGEKINKEYIAGTAKEDFRKINIVSKTLLADEDHERRLLLVIKEV